MSSLHPFSPQYQFWTCLASHPYANSGSCYIASRPIRDWWEYFLLLHAWSQEKSCQNESE
jgi:hypothetical protein